MEEGLVGAVRQWGSPVVRSENPRYIAKKATIFILCTTSNHVMSVF